MNSKWQPIDTAPRDETDILVATVHGQYVVCWFSDSDGGEWYVQSGGGDCQPFYEHPTHWMPLPENPH